MSRAATLALLLAAACSTSRTELMFGVATDLRAPDALDAVQLDIVRVKDGFVEQQVVWDVTGLIDQPFNLPGSYGVYSDGEEVQLDVVLTGLRNNESIVSRRSVVSLVEGQTLFYRIGLTAGCLDRTDCPATSSCVEGVCRDVAVNPLQLPDFDPDFVGSLTCAAAVRYIDTATGDAMPLSGDAAQCPAGQCLEGTCLKPPPASSATRTVRGSQIDTFIEPDKQTTQVPVDLSGLDIAALVPNGPDGVQVFPGTGSADGTFSIPGVPQGTYILRIGTTFTVTAADSIDLGHPELGRPIRAPATGGTGVILNVSNLESWADGDILSAYAPNANNWWFFLDQAVETPPTVGDTALTNFSFTLDDNADGSSLIDNDAFAVVQYSVKTASDGTRYQAASRMFAPPPFKQADGQLTPLSGAFVALPQSGKLSLDVRTLEWENAVGWNKSAATFINPQATPLPFGIDGLTGVSIGIAAQPGGAAFGQISSTIDWAFITVHPERNSLLTDFTFGEPTVSAHSFAPYINASVTYQIPYFAPGASEPVQHLLSVVTQRAISGTSLTVTPPLGPVLAPRINDRDLFIAQNDVPPDSTLTWQAPSVGVASAYTVQVFRLGVNQQGVTTRTSVAFIRTTDTQLAMPPNILQSGQTYFVQITATDLGNIDAPSRRRFPESSAPIASATFSIGFGEGPGTEQPRGPDAAVPPR